MARLPAVLVPLTEEKRWVNWKWVLVVNKNGKSKWTKPPYQPRDPNRHASSSDPKTWDSFARAVQRCEDGEADGIGFMLKGSGIGAIDLDDCCRRDADRKTTKIDKWARELRELADGAYCEVTVSGTGLQLIGTTSGAAEVQRKFTIDKERDASIELFRDTNRYITISGIKLKGSRRRLPSLDKLIDVLLVRYDKPKPSPSSTQRGERTRTAQEWDDLIRNGVPEGERSEVFQAVVWHLATQRWTEAQIVAELARHPDGIGVKYADRLADEVQRSYDKWQASDDDEEDAAGHQQKQADVLIALASEAELFLGIDGAPHADIQRNGHRETYTIASSGFKDWLLHRYYTQVKSAPSGEAIRMALNVVGAKAKKREVFIRAATHADKCYLDLGDEEWRVVEIDADGWRVVTESPVRFRRAKGMKPLPIPITGGTVETLEKYLNIRKKTDADLILIVAWLVAALQGTGPYPIMKIWGEPGSAKSTMVEVLRELVDPNKSTRRQMPKEVRDFHITANNSHVLSFDNVSELKDWASDTLCVMSTGGGFATRTLYTDQEEQIFEGTRPVILNGVENFLMRFDLAERTIVLELLPITPKKRRLERELKAAFAKDRPLILGFLLDLMVHGIRELPNMPSELRPGWGLCAMGRSLPRPGVQKGHIP